MRWPWFVAMLVLSVLCGDVAAKEYALSGRIWLAVLAVALDAAGFACWVVALRNGAGLATGSAIFSVASAVGALLLGWGWYKEPILPHQWAGIGLGVVALTLVTWEG